MIPYYRIYNRQLYLQYNQQDTKPSDILQYNRYEMIRFLVLCDTLDTMWYDAITNN